MTYPIHSDVYLVKNHITFILNSLEDHIIYTMYNTDGQTNQTKVNHIQWR